MWDPKNRPTSKQALDHEFFADALDPLRPKSSTARLLGRKHSDLSFKASRESHESPAPPTKPSWFRRSLIARDSAPAVPQHDTHPTAAPVQALNESELLMAQARPIVNKRSTWADGAAPAVGAPMPILPSIRPISPLSNAVTAQASARGPLCGNDRPEATGRRGEEKAKKIGRQLSLNSHGNHYSDSQAEQGRNGSRGPLSPASAQKEGFFSHLRKRARRLSGRHGLSPPQVDDVEANAGQTWSNRSSMAADVVVPVAEESGNDFSELDKALQSVRYSLEHPSQEPRALPVIPAPATSFKRQQSLAQANAGRNADTTTTATPVLGRTRKGLQMAANPLHRYETPEEEDELLDEVLTTANAAAARLAQYSKAEERQQQQHRLVLAPKDDNHQLVPSAQILGHRPGCGAYPTPSPSAKRNSVLFGQESTTRSQPMPIAKHSVTTEHVDPQWPTPPYEENEWGARAAASIFAAGLVYR
jgi:meiosis induction protein kinase IME2/SME1